MYDIDSIESLKLKDSIKDEGKFYQIDDRFKINILAKEIENSLQQVEIKLEESKGNLSDAERLDNVWGHDCEWKPCTLSIHYNPISTL